jgi:hypothetical protein
LARAIALAKPNNRNRIVYDGGAGSYTKLSHSQLVLRLSWAVTIKMKENELPESERIDGGKFSILQGVAQYLTGNQENGNMT